MNCSSISFRPYFIFGILLILLCGISPEANYAQSRIERAKKQEQRDAYQSELKLAMSFFNRSDFDKAIPILEKLIADRPSQYLYSYLFRAFIQQQKYKDAEDLVKRMKKRQKSYYRYEVDLAYTYLKQGKEKKAQKAINDILDKLPPDKTQVINIANALIARQLFDEAARVYARGKKMIPSYSFYSELANLALYQGDFHGMMRMYILQLKDDPDGTGLVKSRLQYYLAQDVQGTLSDMFRRLLLEAAHKYPDNYAYVDLLMWISLQQKDFDMAMIQAKALDIRFDQTGQRVFELAQICLNNGKLDAAEDGFAYLKKKYSAIPNLEKQAESGLLETQFKKLKQSKSRDAKQWTNLVKSTKNFLEKGQLSRSQIPLIKAYVEAQAFELSKPQVAIQMLDQAMRIIGISQDQQAELKLIKADIWVLTDDVWDAKLLYMQVEKEMKREPIGHLAKFKNAELSYYLGEFGWAIGLLDILKSATTKFISNDALDLSLRIKDNLKEDTLGYSLKVYAQAELLIKQHQNEKAIYLLDSLNTFTDNLPLKGDILFLKANIRMKEANYIAADSLLQELVKQYPDELLADDALMELGRLHEYQLMNLDQAMAFYEELFLNYPASIYAREARGNYRRLKN